MMPDIYRQRVFAGGDVAGQQHAGVDAVGSPGWMPLL